MRTTISFVLAVAALLHLACGDDANALKLPVYFVPPLTGVGLDVRLTGSKPPSWLCPTKTNGWSKLWIVPQALLPPFFPCFVDDLRMIFDGVTNTSRSPLGVEVRPTHDFETQSLLNPLTPLIHELKRRGWQEGLNLQAHIYDWRLSPNDWARPSLEHGWAKMAREIEDLHRRNGGRRVVLAGISMGCTYTNAFLAGMPKAWKQKHLAGFFSLSGLFGGTPAATQGIISSRLNGLEVFFKREDVTTLMRSVPALAWLAPHPDVYGAAPQVFNAARGTAYSAGHLDEPLMQAGATQAALAWRQQFVYPNHLPPGIPAYIMYSRGLDTVEKLRYEKADYSDDPQISYTEGDSTVPLAGLVAAPERWQQLPDQPPVLLTEWGSVGHAGILMARGAVDYIVDKILRLGLQQQGQQ